MPAFSARRSTGAAALLVAALPLTSVLAQGPFTGRPLYRIQVQQAAGTPAPISGSFDVEMFPTIAPRHVRNWDSLVVNRFYDSTAFHRVVPGFVIQGGDPNSRRGPRSTWGQGQPNQPTVRAEFSAVSYVRGILGAARTNDPNSADSQFFITVAPAPNLDRNYTVYGRVRRNMALVDQIVRAARDGNDNPLRKIEMFITRLGSVDSSLAAATLRAPADGATVVADPLLRWRRVPGALLYTAEISPDAGFNSGVIRPQASQFDSTLTVAATLLQPATLYYWRLKATNGGEVSTSAVRTFRTGLPAPTLQLPTLGDQQVPVMPTLQWTAVPGAEAYDLQIARTRLFLPAASIYFSRDSIVGTTFQVPTALPALQICYWRVRARQGGIAGFQSTVWNFKTQAVTGLLSEIETGLDALHPNPTAAGNVVRLTGATGPLTVLDALGRVVRIATGETVPTAGLAPGVYGVRSSGVVQRLVVE